MKGDPLHTYTLRINIPILRTFANAKTEHRTKMKYSIDKQDRYAVMTLDVDNLNSMVAPDLKSEFVIFRNEGIPNFILNLENVKYVDSSGLSAILTGNRLWKGTGTFIVTGVRHAAVKKLIEISRLGSILQVIPTISESVDYLYMEQLEKQLEEE